MLLGFLVAIAASGLVLLVVRWKELAGREAPHVYLTRETALGAGALVLLLSAAVILFGTSLPIFSSSSVEPAFYDTTNLPIAIVMVLLVGFSLAMQWEEQDARETLRRSWKSLAVAAVVTAALALVGVRDPLMALLAFASLFALAVNVDTGLRVARGDWRFLGGKIAHIGLALFFLGVISTGKYSSSKQAALPLNTPVDVLGRTLTYKGNVQLPDGKFGFNVEVKEGNTTVILQPVMFDAGQQGVMRNPDIASFLTRDIYISPLGLEEGNGHTHEGDRHTLPKGGTVKLGDAEVTFERFDMGSHGAEMADGGMTVGSVLEVRRGSERETVTPAMVYSATGTPQYRNATSRLLGGEVQLLSMNVGGESSPSVVTVELRRPGGETASQRIAGGGSERETVCEPPLGRNTRDDDWLWSGNNKTVKETMRETAEAEKLPSNAPGKYYTTEECDGCAYCASVAPENFEYEKSSNTYYIVRQPQNSEEEDFVREAMEDCPVDAIRLANGISARSYGD